MNTRRAMTTSRRSFLARAGAAGVGAPLFTGLLGRANAADLPAKPYRLIVVRDGNGFGSVRNALSPHRLVPPRARNTNGGAPLPLTSLPAAPLSPGAREVAFTSAADLPLSLTPLRRWWQSTMVLDRFFNPHNVGLHGNGQATYTVMPRAAPGEEPSVPLELAVARALGANLPFPVVRMDHKGDTPANYFHRYLGGIGGAGVAQLQQRRGVLAVVNAQASRLKGTLGRDDLQRLGGYLDSLRQAERSLEQLITVKCEGRVAPTVGGNVSEREPMRPLISHANIDTAAAALICGLSRVVSIGMMPGRGPFQFFDPNPNAYNMQGALAQQAISSDTTYADLVTGLRLESVATGESENSWGLDRHNNHHNGNPQMLTAMDRWEAALVARLIERLQNTPEGKGTMWDHTLILWANDGGGCHHNGANDHPVILVGGPAVMEPGGDRAGLLRGGRYLSFPPGKRAISDLFVSVLQTLGINEPTFGDPRICKGSLPGARA